MSAIRERFPPQGLAGMIVHGPAWQTDRTRRWFLPCPTDPPTSSTWLSAAGHAGNRMQDTFLVTTHLTTMLPVDFVSLNSVYPVCGAEGTGNMVWGIGVNLAADGEVYNTHSGTLGPYTDGMVQNVIEVMDDHDLTALFAAFDINDLIDMAFTREGNNVADTINADVIFLGWLFSYEADM